MTERNTRTPIDASHWNQVDATDFVAANTCAVTVGLVPEVTLLLAHESLAMWQMTEPELTESGLPAPFWAFAWAGGQALARYILDNEPAVHRKRVLDFASGSGLVGIAAAMAGATSVLAADLDPMASAACALNARENRVVVSTTEDDFIGQNTDAFDVILAGDVFYEQPMAEHVERWLRGAHAGGATVLVGDPGRSYFPRQAMTELATYDVPVLRALEDCEFRRTTVWCFS
ncbi:MAG: putative nicotinamide N-methyase [Gammaproteobacteria bacterium]|jgi:predicted nicotinamide N-methyase